MNIIRSALPRGMFLITPAGTDLATKAYGLLFTAAGTFTGITELGDAITFTTVAGQRLDCVFKRVSAAPANTFGFKLA